MPRVEAMTGVRELTGQAAMAVIAQSPRGPLFGCCLRGARRSDWVYSCTRPMGHDGPHVAHVNATTVATWPSASETARVTA